MRVIAGIAKKRRLIGPKGGLIRPAIDKVKEAVFDILFDVQGLDVLDLFAGTGSMGIEAISRGASHAVFVDSSENSIKLIKKNLKLCSFEDRAWVMKSYVRPAVRRLAKIGKRFDIVFVDPPYLKGLVNPTLAVLSPIMKPSSIIIIEHHPKELLLPHEGLVATDCRKYGQTLISFVGTVEKQPSAVLPANSQSSRTL